MDKRRSRFIPGAAFVEECLEGRVVLSAIGSAGVVPTRTSLKISAGTLAQPVTLTATVRADAGAASPTGTVEIIEQGDVIATLPLSPTTASGGKQAASGATATLTATPGGPAFYFGKHEITAVYVPSGGFAASGVRTSFTTRQPPYTTLAGGVKVVTIADGSGAELQEGQTASVLYTGYLAKNGQIFDDSIDHGGSPLSFTAGAGDMIPGFEEGVADMKVGETRIISIPPAMAYGKTAVGSIPANSKLIFVVTLESIS